MSDGVQKLLLVVSLVLAAGMMLVFLNKQGAPVAGKAGEVLNQGIATQSDINTLPASPSSSTSYVSSSKYASYKTSSGSVSFSAKDYLGSSRLSINEKGTLIAELMQDPFGSPIVSKKSTQPRERFTYTGKEQDLSGLYDYGARNYDSYSGRFFQNDPKYAANPYVYVDNNPLAYTDPTGREKESVRERVRTYSKVHAVQMLDRLVNSEGMSPAEIQEIIIYVATGGNIVGSGNENSNLPKATLRGTTTQSMIEDKKRLSSLLELDEKTLKVMDTNGRGMSKEEAVKKLNVIINKAERKIEPLEKKIKELQEKRDSTTNKEEQNKIDKEIAETKEQKEPYEMLKTEAERVKGELQPDTPDTEEKSESAPTTQTDCNDDGKCLDEVQQI